MMMIIVVIIIMGIMMQHRLLTMLNIKTFIYLITFKSNEKFEATVIKQIKNPVSIIKISCQSRCMTYKIIAMMTMSTVLMMIII